MALRANEAITRASAKVLGLQTAPAFGDGHLHNGMQALFVAALLAVGRLDHDARPKPIECVAVGAAQTVPGVQSNPVRVKALQSALARVFVQALQRGLVFGFFAGLGEH